MGPKYVLVFLLIHTGGRFFHVNWIFLLLAQTGLVFGCELKLDWFMLGNLESQTGAVPPEKACTGLCQDPGYLVPPGSQM